MLSHFALPVPEPLRESVSFYTSMLTGMRLWGGLTWGPTTRARGVVPQEKQLYAHWTRVR